MNEYEKFQLALIAQDYRGRGFEVRTEVRMPRVEYTFDAVATSPSNNDTVFIELVNKNRSQPELQRRESAYEQAARNFPNARVDLRYIDNDASPYYLVLQREEARGGVEISSVAALLKTRLPSRKSGGDELRDAQHLLALWSVHSLTIRGIAAFKYSAQSSTLGIMEAYNLLLQDGSINAPEALDEEISLDLFQIFEAVSACINGAIVDSKFTSELKLHIHSFRNQLAKLKWQLPIPE